MSYLWLKALHLISMVCWFAAIFYLPRLFVYHAQSEDAVSKARFCIMERKLLKGIMTPSAVATLFFGGWLITKTPNIGSWLMVKLVLVFLVLGYHMWCAITVKKFAADNNTRSHTFYRVMNEIPVLALFAIIILAVVKPW